MVTIAPAASSPKKNARKKIKEEKAILEDYENLKASQQQSGDYSGMKLRKGATVWLDMKLEGADKTAAGGPAYVSVGRCSVVDPAPLMYCPAEVGGDNVVSNLHDYTTVTCDQFTTDDIGWLDTVLGRLDVFHPVGKKDLRCGYPEIKDPEERKIKNMFKAEVEWSGASKVVTMRKQVNCYFFFFFVVSCLI